MLSTHPAKMKKVEYFTFAELLRCIIGCTNHIHMYFISTNAVETILGVGVVSPPSKTKNVEHFIYAEVLRCIVDCTNHIHMYFISTNTVETIARVGVMSPLSINGKFIKKYFCWPIMVCS